MDLIRKMLSIPPELPLNHTQRFTFISALVAYLISGLSMFLAPDLWNKFFHLDFDLDKARGYFVLVASGLVDIGFCLVVLSRNKSSQEPNSGPLIATVISRLVLVNGFAIIYYMKGLVTAQFASLFGILDSTLAVITYVIWSLENKDASLVKFFEDIWSALNPFSQRPPGYALFQLLGFLQFVLGFVAPSILLSCGIVPSSIEGSHAEGLFRTYLFMLSLHAYFKTFAAGSQNDSYPIGSVFYRLTWNIPVFLFLGFTSQIHVALAITLIIYDAIFIVLTITLFAKENNGKKN